MIHSMLLNPAYAGQALYGRRQSVPWRPPLHPPRGHDGLPRRSWRQAPAPTERHISIAVPALIDEDLFVSVAEQLEENRRRSRERLAGVQYLLRGLLVCEKCGYGFTGYHPVRTAAVLSLLRHGPQPLPWCVPVQCPAGCG